MSETGPVDKSHKARHAAEVAGGAVALGGAAYAIWRKYHRNRQTYEDDTEFSEYKKSAAIFEAVKSGKQADIDKQRLLAQIAVQVHFVSFESPQRLVEQFEISRKDAQGSLDTLVKNKLVKLSDTTSDNDSYEATSALDWAVQDGNYPCLSDAYMEMVSRNTAGNW